MANGGNKNYVSVWFWFFALLVMAIPCVGFVMIIVWAFWGENESRKNYFRALIIWSLIGIVIVGVVMALGLMPAILNELHRYKIRGR